MSFTSRFSMKSGAAIIAGLFLAGIGIIAIRGGGTPAAKVNAEGVELVAAPGRVEPASGEIQVSFDLNGTLCALPVNEGDHIVRGQTLAELVNDDYRARVVSAEAELRLKEAELRRILNGARPQERLEAEAAVREAEAVVQNASVELERCRALYASQNVSRAQLDQGQRDYDVARARLEAAREHFRVIDDPPREEDRARAEADVSLARGQLEEARALLAKTVLRSPLNGIVLRKHLRAGESVSALTPTPVLTIADTSTLRVRAEVDEGDVARIRVGQRAWATAEAYGSMRFPGHVLRIGEVLGRKEVHTDDPVERVDTKVLQTLIELDRGTELPIGLRVDTYIVVREKGRE
jgi:ABC exporter DevB family membrane fusion protein